MKKGTATKVKSKILWSVDPYAADDQSLQLGFKAAQALQGVWGRPIEPVYVLSPESFHYPGDFSDAWTKNFLPHLNKMLADKLAPFQDADLLPAKVIINKNHGRRLAVKKLLDYAKRSEQAPIVLPTQGKKGLARWIMGSFAESAVLMARTPLYVVPPGADIQPIKKVLFPTNFSRSSKLFIQKQAGWMKKGGVEAVVYHKLPEPYDPFVQSSLVMAGGGWVSIQAFLQEESLKRQKDGDKLKEQLKAKSISAQFVLDAEPGALSDGVLKVVREQKLNMIALVSESSSVSATLIGSLARELCRQATCPIWVSHGSQI